MTALIQIMAVIAPAGCIGFALAALAVSRLRRDPGITIERGVPHELPSDGSFTW